MARKDFTQVAWDAETMDDCRHLVRLAVREDLGRGYDLTTLALVSREAQGSALVVAREAGVVAGLLAAECVLDEMRASVTWQALVAEGAQVARGTAVAQLTGQTRDLLTVERPVLNFLGKLSGIATLTRRYVEAVATTSVRIYDTRKTTPGWRRLEKYAVRCGGGTNHRTGLFDAILIKDNHLAQGQCDVANAIRIARDFLVRHGAEHPEVAGAIVEVEVDTLDQLDAALTALPDIVLLDNMTCEALREAVRRRDAAGVDTELEASGGIHLDSIRAVAETGVERISVGALTHSAISLDLGLDWCF